MGMTCTLHRVTPSEIDQLVKDPAKVSEILFADDENWTVTKPGGLVGFLLRFTPMSIETATPREPLNEEDLDKLRERECDLEGTWHGLHFLFTGTAWEGAEPACYLVRGGEAVGGDEFDDPPRLLRPDLVRGFRRFLDGLSEDELRGRFDRRRMSELSIDPARLWLRRATPADEALALLLRAFNELRTFTERAATAGDGVIVHLA
ncbi:MAG TPA: YfbM family protein [Dehalococcoidia bacterium]|nr:YfbM family protein [Dehalococcoidia bacterium]